MYANQQNQAQPQNQQGNQQGGFRNFLNVKDCISSKTGQAVYRHHNSRMGEKS